MEYTNSGVNNYIRLRPCWLLLQDELSDAGGGGSKSATPISTATSDAAMAPVDTVQTEESEGLNRNLNSSSEKPDSNKNIKVQDTVVTEAYSKGESCCPAIA